MVEFRWFNTSVREDEASVRSLSCRAVRSLVYEDDLSLCQVSGSSEHSCLIRNFDRGSIANMLCTWNWLGSGFRGPPSIRWCLHEQRLPGLRRQSRQCIMKVRFAGKGRQRLKFYNGYFFTLDYSHGSLRQSGNEKQPLWKAPCRCDAVQCWRRTSLIFARITTEDRHGARLLLNLPWKQIMTCVRQTNGPHCPLK